MIRIGINGFGRIGRALTRILLNSSDIQLVVINELDNDIDNLSYLLKYDTLYGRLGIDVSVDKHSLVINNEFIPVFSVEKITDVKWDKYNLDVLIEASGVGLNVGLAHELISKQIVPKVVVTNASSNVDKTIIVGVNEHEYEPSKHHVISSSICDANAVAPLLNLVDKNWGIEAVFLTTLHPWLSYQNLLDGPVSSILSPGHSWGDYSLGRASASNLIPKDTTAGVATSVVLPHLSSVIEALSFRVPTHIVSASDLAIKLKKSTTISDVNNCFEEIAKKYPHVFCLEKEALVSSDYTGAQQSCIVDARRTKVIGGTFLKMVAWYDNEWGYSNRVLDVARLVNRGVDCAY
jgi:glyceraldehyde 3-phosphate dehydrogenase